MKTHSTPARILAWAALALMALALAPSAHSGTIRSGEFIGPPRSQAFVAGNYAMGPSGSELLTPSGPWRAFDEPGQGHNDATTVVVHGTEDCEIASGTDDITVVLFAVPPTLTTPTVTDMGTTSATLGANITDDGGAAISSWGTS
jgi:hypothetical protein